MRLHLVGLSLCLPVALAIGCTQSESTQVNHMDISASAAAKGNNVKKIGAAEFTPTGELLRPKNYRTWVFVGTPVTPNDMNDGKAPFPEFHNVYIDPDSYEHYKKTGTFREGTVLIKELVSVGSKQAVSGKGYFQGEFIGLEAEVKSAKQFPDEPGNWAYFSFTVPKDQPVKTQAKAFATADCNTCHQGSAQDDFVFTQYYPVLRAVKGKGKNVENLQGKANAPAAPPAADKTWAATAKTPANVPSVIPTNNEKLFAYLKAGTYRDFPAQESKTHPGRGPHTAVGNPVRVYMDQKLAESLKSGNQEHPAGSAAIKEMYTKDNQLTGWAVMVKTSDKTDDGKGWFWYEVTSTTDPSKVPASGNGVPGCVRCHAPGKDMVLTNFPLN